MSTLTGNLDVGLSSLTLLEVPLVVLINGNSASASEILAGAVKDYEIGTLVGTTTFGKGIVQSIFKLKDGDFLATTYLVAAIIIYSETVLSLTYIYIIVVADTYVLSVYWIDCTCFE